MPPNIACITSCCSATCDIGSDDFTRSDNTSLGSDWTESSGSWDITSNQLRCTSAGLAIYNTAHPDGDITQRVSVNFKHNTAASRCEVVVGLVDSTHYYYARYIVDGSSGFVAIRKKDGASDTLLEFVSQTISTNTTYEATVCVSPDGKIAASLNGITVVSTDAQTITGTQVGLSASLSGTATFDDFVFDKGYEATNAPDCELCEDAVCTTCTSDEEDTLEAEVIIIGVTDGSCTDCAATYNQTHILPRYTVFGEPCSWFYNPTPSLTCSGSPFTPGVSLSISYNAVTNTTEMVVFLDGVGGNNSFIYSDIGRLHCSDIVGLVFTFATNPGACNSAAATCTVSLI